MFMGEQMILTVFIISIALGTETKLQIVSVQLCTSADRTLMSDNGSHWHSYIQKGAPDA